MRNNLIELSSLMDKTMTDIINEKTKYSSHSHYLEKRRQSVNKSFRKKIENWTNIKNEDVSLRSILERKSDNKQPPSFLGYEESKKQTEIIKKYQSSNLDNFVIEEETGWNQDEENSAKLSKDLTKDYIEKGNGDYYENIKQEDEESRLNEKLTYANEVADFLSSESKNKLFKVTEEDTNHEKFSITVNSDKFQTNSKMHSEFNSLKKKAQDSEMAIKDIYNVDLERDNFKKMIHKDIKLSAHGKYDEMSSSNDAKFTTYKSDMRNKHFNTQVAEEISTGSIQGIFQDKTINNEVSENIYEKKNFYQPNHNEAILEKIQESFSDHEEMPEEQDEHENSSCVRETYTVDSSSDDHEENNRNDQSLFSELSQVSHLF